MRQVTCERCGRAVPTNDSFVVLGQTTCRACLDAALAAGTRYEESAVKAQTDPTVCANCRTDAGARELPRVAGRPMCQTCTDHFRNRPFPMWVKISFLALVVLAGVMLLVNLRFFQGHFEAKASVRAFEAGDVERAAALMQAAAGHVPEEEALRSESLLLRGVILLGQDKSAEALQVLREARQYGHSRVLEFYLLGAEGDMAFFGKDYDTFLERARSMMAMEPDHANVVGLVASALACKYAATADEKFRDESLKMLEKARSLAGEARAADYEQYARRIRYRLETREIITRQEYEKRFPQGHDQGPKP